MIKKQLSYVFLTILIFDCMFLIQNTYIVKSISVSNVSNQLTNVQTNSSNYVTSFDILTTLSVSANSEVDVIYIESFLLNSYLLTHNINVSYADYMYSIIVINNIQAEWMHAHSFLISLYNSTSDIGHNSSYVRIWRDFWNVLRNEINPYFSYYQDIKEMTASRNSTHLGMYYLLASDAGWSPTGFTLTSGVSFTLQAFVHFNMNYSVDYVQDSINDFPKPFLPYSMYRHTNSVSDTLYLRFITIAPIMILIFVVFYLIKKLTNNENYIGIAILPCSIFVLIYLQASSLEYFVTIGLAGAITLAYFKKKHEVTNIE